MHNTLQSKLFVAHYTFMKPFSLCALTLLGLIDVFSSARADEKMPSPATAIHPGADTAPASSPITYEDEAGFQQRARLLLQNLATNDLGQWRRGYFTGGDPGKYLPGAAMAKLMLDPNNEEARRYQNDDRSYKEQYHFASVNWARYLPLFGDTLTPETKAKVADAAFRADAYLKPGGTENHKTMWWTSANVLPVYLNGGVAHKTKVESLAQAKELLRAYAKGLYAAGQGEWDSSTYIMFDVNGMLNVYDFSPDPECRLLAKAALDWLTTGMALKWRDGIYTAPNQRGFYDQPFESIAARTGWLWWNASTQPPPEILRTSLYTVHPITSSYRPNAVISHLATKKLREPVFEARNSKPNYWHGQGLKPTPGAYEETVFNGRTYTLGSLWNGFGGQTTRWQLVAQSANGGVAFTGGNPRKSDHEKKLLDEISYGDGSGRYDQSAQLGGTLISLSHLPATESLDYSFLSIPAGVSPPQKHGAWFTMRVGETFVGVRSLGGEATVGETDLTEKQRAENATEVAKGNAPKYQTQPILRFPGRRTGFILQVASAYDNFFILRHEGAFKPLNATIARPTIEQLYQEFGQELEKRAVDTTKLQTEGEVSYQSFDAAFPNDGRLAVGGTTLRVKFQDDKDRALAWVDGEPVSFDSDAIYQSRYIRQKNSVLSVNDGEAGFVVDFSSALPVYRIWKP